METNVLTILAFVLYALMILAIGIYSFKKSKSMSDYFIGGRSLGLVDNGYLGAGL